jgi:hypothetical protein
MIHAQGKPFQHILPESRGRPGQGCDKTDFDSVSRDRGAANQKKYNRQSHARSPEHRNPPFIVFIKQPNEAQPNQFVRPEYALKIDLKFYILIRLGNLIVKLFFFGNEYFFWN